MQSLLAEIELLKEKNEILRDLQTQSTSQYKALMIKLESQSCEYQIRIEQQRQQHQKQINDLLQHLDTAKSENDELHQQNVSLSQRIKDGEHKYRVLEEQCKRKEHEMNQLRSNLQAIQCEIVDVKSKLHEMSTVNNLQSQVIDDLQEKLVIIHTSSTQSISPRSCRKNRTLRIPVDVKHPLSSIHISLQTNGCSSSSSKSAPFVDSASIKDDEHIRLHDGESEDVFDCVFVRNETFYDMQSPKLLTPSDVHSKVYRQKSAASKTPTFYRNKRRVQY